MIRGVTPWPLVGSWLLQHTTNDCSPASRLHQKNDSRPPQLPLAQYDHRLLQPQETSRTAADNRKKIHGGELTPIIPRRRHHPHRSIWVAARLNSRSLQQRILESTRRPPPSSQHAPAGPPGSMGTTPIMACTTSCQRPTPY
jgi:hypothetical protein